MNIKELDFYRIPQKGLISGVCAGLSEQFNMPTWAMRALWILAGIYISGIALLIYVIMWMSLDKRKSKFDGLSDSSDSGGVAQQIKSRFQERARQDKGRSQPTSGEKALLLKQTLASYDKVETRLQKIEQYVTSTEFTLSREINKL